MNRGKTRNMLTPSSVKKLVNVFEWRKATTVKVVGDSKRLQQPKSHGQLLPSSHVSRSHIKWDFEEYSVKKDENNI